MISKLGREAAYLSKRTLLDKGDELDRVGKIKLHQTTHRESGEEL